MVLQHHIIPLKLQSPMLQAGISLTLTVLSAQASTNTILAHFASIIFANWLQKILLKPSKSGIAAAKPDEPDYTQRKAPSGTSYG